MDLSIVVTRVREEFETQQVVVPFERQELRNESLTSGETRLVQAGQNGLDEITIRHVFENNVETSSSVVSETILQDAVPEIVMIGVQSPFAPISFPGKLVYLTGGNAWVMDGSTSIRHPLVTTGDLDGHIFSLSSDGEWLLFTRKSSLPVDQQINTLWAVNTSDRPPAPVNLNIDNIVHFAGWQPTRKYLIAYSTVEPRATAPGWQANNDLHLLTFENGKPGKTFDALEANSGGLYGWWGMLFAWSPDGNSLAYSRPDGVGLTDLGGAGFTKLLDITPWNTHGDWAWTPGLAWGSDNQNSFPGCTCCAIRFDYSRGINQLRPDLHLPFNNLQSYACPADRYVRLSGCLPITKDRCRKDLFGGIFTGHLSGPICHKPVQVVCNGW